MERFEVSFSGYDTDQIWNESEKYSGSTTTIIRSRINKYMSSLGIILNETLFRRMII